MRRRLVGAIAGSLAALSLIAAGSATAAVEFGDSCVADDTDGAPIMFWEVSHPENPLSTAAPVSGVLTKWRMNLDPGVPIAIPTTLKVVRVAPLTVTVIGEATGPVRGGANALDARIPIQAGDHLAVAGASEIGALICEAPVDGTVGAAITSIVGSPSQKYEQGGAEFRVPLVGVIEPDADGDGYGDETQDGCPQSAAYQTPCPVVRLDTVNLSGKSSATIIVATSLATSVQVSGTVQLGKGGKVALKAKGKTVGAGRLSRFKLKFPTKLKERLKELPPGEKLTLKVVASATNVTGRASTDKSNVKLKGQGK